MNIQEDYVSFETAKLLKEKGFDGILPFIYVDTEKSDREVHLTDTLCNYNDGHIEDVISAPTLQMVLKWLREKHNIHIEIIITNRSMSDMFNIIKYYWVMTNTETGRWCDESTVYTAKAFDKSEEAEEDAIRHALEKLN